MNIFYKYTNSGLSFFKHTNFKYFHYVISGNRKINPFSSTFARRGEPNMSCFVIKSDCMRSLQSGGTTISFHTTSDPQVYYFSRNEVRGGAYYNKKQGALIRNSIL